MHRKSSVLFLHVAVLLFGFAGVISRFVSLPAVLVTFYRVLFASSSLLILSLARREKLRLHRRSDYFLLFAAGAVMAVHWTSFIQSIQVSSVAIGTITFSTFPLFATFLEPLVYREKLRAFDVATALVMVGGVLVTIPEFSIQNQMTAGIAWGMLSSLSYAVLSLMNRRFAGQYSGRVICLYEQGSAVLLLLPAPFLIQASYTVSDWGSLLFMGVVCTALAHTLYVGSLKNVRVQTASVISGMETVYGILLAFLLLHEAPSGREVLGGAIIIAAAMASTFAKNRQKP